MTDEKNIYFKDEYVGKVRVVGTEHLENEGESVCDRYYVKMVDGTDAPITAIHYGLKALFRMRRCTCEHDCCGHWFGGVTSIKYKESMYEVTVRYYMNV